MPTQLSYGIKLGSADKNSETNGCIKNKGIQKAIEYVSWSDSYCFRLFCVTPIIINHIFIIYSQVVVSDGLNRIIRAKLIIGSSSL